MTEMTEKGSVAFCTECGAKLDEGAAFCVECGTPTESPAKEEAADAANDVAQAASAAAPAPTPTAVQQALQLGQTAAMAPVEAASQAAQAAPAKRGASPVIIGVIAGAVVLAIIVAVIVLFAMPDEQQAPEGDSVPGEAQSDEGEGGQVLEEDGIDVDLPNTFVTDYPQVTLVTYPNFAIDYPDGWKVESHETESAGERFEIVNESSSAIIVFEFGNEGDSAGMPTRELDSLEKVADCEFEPEYVQSNDLTYLGDFMVAKAEISFAFMYGARDDSSFEYVVAPEAALDDESLVSVQTKDFSFDYSSPISLCCAIPEGGFDEQTKAEVIATLASFRLADEKEVKLYAGKDGDTSTSDVLEADYVLPDSSTRLLTAADLQGLDDYELFVARNEIFARHGRIFQKEELQEHFGSKSWYHPSIAPENFTDSMLSDTERKNIETIKAIEESHGSVWLLP